GAGTGATIVQANAARNTATSQVFINNGVGQTVTIRDMTIQHGNCVGPCLTGGGVFNEEGDLTLDTVIIKDNDAQSGGGVYVEFGSVTITDSIITNNTASSLGGGIYNQGIIPSITNSIISSNIALTEGGGLFNRITLTTITNSSITGNSAPQGGGLAQEGDPI